MFTANLLPGQGFHEFTVYKQSEGVTETGRPVKGAIAATDIKFMGTLVNANQKEKDQWKQNGHPITHKVIEFSAQNKAEATNYLVAPDGRQFYVQGARNPGDLNVTMIYYVEERLDIKRK